MGEIVMGGGKRKFPGNLMFFMAMPIQNNEEHDS
jgi:hypothetical protein